MTLDLRGLIPATVLPLTEDALIDEPALRRYMRHVAAAGPKALAINADTGEGPHLWPQERRRVLEIVVDEVGDRVPVIAGLGAQFTEQAIVVADAVSSFDPELHRATLRNIELKYGVVMTTEELLAAVAPPV